MALAMAAMQAERVVGNERVDRVVDPMQLLDMRHFRDNSVAANPIFGHFGVDPICCKVSVPPAWLGCKG
jgi:hypothetical protein